MESNGGSLDKLGLVVPVVHVLTPFVYLEGEGCVRRGERGEGREGWRRGIMRDGGEWSRGMGREDKDEEREV